jgi:hypothetical protein
MASLSDSLGANSVELDGFMEKRGEHGLQLFRRRFFMLRDTDLYYMLDDSLESKLNPLGKIDLRLVTRVDATFDVVSLFGATVHHIYLCTAQRVYDLALADKADAQRWVDKINDGRALHERRVAAAAAAAPTAASTAHTGALWLDGKEPELHTLMSPVSSLKLPPLLPAPVSPAAPHASVASAPAPVPARGRSDSATTHGYEAVPAEVLKAFRFTDGFALEQFLSLLETPLHDAVAHAQRSGFDAVSATLFAAALLVRALGADALQFNDAVPRTAPLAVSVAREYAQMHDLLVRYLHAHASQLEAQTATLDRWVLTQRQRLLFGDGARLELASLDRIGVLRWHLLSLCQFASARLEPLRQRSDGSDTGLESLLYAWDLMTDRLLGEVSRLPMATVGTHLWSVLIESDEYRRDAAALSSAAPDADDDDNPYEAQLRRARERVGAPLQNAIASRLPRCDEATQDVIQRLLHADGLMKQLVDELDALGFFDDLSRLLKLFTEATLALSAAVDSLTPLKPYRAVMREQRVRLLSAWWQSAQACGGASLLLERAAAGKRDRAALAPKSDPAAAVRKWADVLTRCTALLKRVASLVDSRQFSVARDAVLLCAIEVQGTLPAPAHLQVSPLIL